MPEQASLFRSGVPLDSPRGPFAMGSCLDHAWLSQELSILLCAILSTGNIWQSNISLEKAVELTVKRTSKAT